MKKLIVLLLACVMLLSLAACASKTTDTTTTNDTAADTAADTTENTDSTDTSSEDASTDGESNGYTGGEYTLVVASHNNATTAAGSGLQKLCELIEEYSDGKIKCELYTDGKLGSQSETASEIRNGGIDICENDWATMASANGYAKGSVVSLGYMFQDYDHVMAFYKSDVFKQMTQELIDQTGIRCLAGSASGFRHIFTKTPVTTLDDLNGLRIRVPDIQVYVDTFQALGCATTIVASSEVYTALQTGIVDAVENPYITVYNASWYEQLSYITKTYHIWCDLDYFMNEAKYESLDDEAKAVIDRAAEDAQAYGMSYSEEMEDYYEDLLVNEYGLEIVDIDTDAIKAKMQETVWKNFEDTVDGGADLIASIQALAN